MIRQFCPICVSFEMRQTFLHPFETHEDRDYLVLGGIPASSCIDIGFLNVERIRTKSDLRIPLDAKPFLDRGVVDWDRSFHMTPSPVAWDGGCVIEPSDYIEFRCSDELITQVPKRDEVPEWDEQRRALLFGGVELKRYRRPADNQIPIFQAFQEEGWPRKIDDPLPGSEHVTPKKRLSDTVAKINRGIRKHGLVRFELDGTGEGIIWRREE